VKVAKVLFVPLGATMCDLVPLPFSEYLLTGRSLEKMSGKVRGKNEPSASKG